MKKIILLFALLTGVVASAQKKATVDCSQIKTEKGKAAGEVYYITPYVDGISIKKVKDAESTTYICTVKVLADTKQTGKEVSVLFDNGNLIRTKEANVLEGPMQKKQFEYYAIFIVTDEEMTYFRDNIVMGVQAMDVVQGAESPDTIKKLADCLIQK